VPSLAELMSVSQPHYPAPGGHLRVFAVISETALLQTLG